ncbi:type I-E CRISPR-associated endoribonuclease Cas2e [Lactobacillus gasseri]|jgi:CRISPR-associated protein Cas2|uniref:type I-E CRISPR-associated endoribonuclease Cas2e n=1 Tax=Lactobacillus gasseri TaxID=1596 RepID=UPI001F55BABF|nr:type I-E CRISPR-associated endoribonuclease Cas2e [Lactobacillus gasseri]UNL44138.1 type I-E CRISPR-associated endoribonuclease Cas2 [Lactobacillus gasseri]
MIVITLSKTPNSLRGDLTKWCQEIQTGVYVGNLNAKVRELLWERIEKNIGGGEATMVYNTNNELGYTFRTNRKDKRVVDFDGIPFLMHINKPSDVVLGFSNAAKFHKVHRVSSSAKKIENQNELQNFVAIDLETTGLNFEKDRIISIAAVKDIKKNEPEIFYRLIKDVPEVPEHISKLTGLTTKQLRDSGVSLKDALIEFKKFVGSRLIVGYNLPFDMSFLENSIKEESLNSLENRAKDILPIVERKNKFLEDYHLDTVLKKYDIENENPHHADSDAKGTWYLAKKLIEIKSLII